MIFPARKGSLNLRLATYLVTVKPRPNPAKPLIIAEVLFIIPYSPNPSFPMIRAKINEEIIAIVRDIIVPVAPQNAPFAIRNFVSEPK